MKKLRAFFILHKMSILTVCCLFALQTFFYTITNHLISSYHIIHIRLDDMIPFCPAFAIFYLLWFPYVPLLFIAGLKQSRSLFRRQLLTVFVGDFLCVLLFLIYPSAIDFRPSADGSGFFLWVCRLIYSLDEPVNVFPSLHCYNALSIHMAAFCGTPLGKHRGWRLLSLLLCIMICLSTAVIKQHSVLDGIVGCTLAILLFFVFKLPVFGRFYDRKTL